MSRRAFRRAGQEDLDQFGPEVRSETKVHLSSITVPGAPRAYGSLGGHPSVSAG
jgi:hypothetical protein